MTYDAGEQLILLPGSRSRSGSIEMMNHARRDLFTGRRAFNNNTPERYSEHYTLEGRARARPSLGNGAALSSMFNKEARILSSLLLLDLSTGG